MSAPLSLFFLTLLVKPIVGASATGKFQMKGEGAMKKKKVNTSSVPRILFSMSKRLLYIGMRGYPFLKTVLAQRFILHHLKYSVIRSCGMNEEVEEIGSLHFDRVIELFIQNVFNVVNGLMFDFCFPRPMQYEIT